MSPDSYRVEKDSLGEVRVPVGALYGPQTQRAVENFQISELRFPLAFLCSLALIKRACAVVNRELDQLDPEIAAAIAEASAAVESGAYQEQFPVDIMQTGSGTSTNMNINEVVATLASQRLGRRVHPNDHVNRSQSSNDVIPTAIRISARGEMEIALLPALDHLVHTLDVKAREVDNVVKSGRTHLMDALPIRMGQELRAWRDQVVQCRERIHDVIPRLTQLPIGGTAIGTGVNAPAGFGERVVEYVSTETGLAFAKSPNPITSISSADTAVELSGALKTLAVSVLKISNDLRWMNSGPNSGLGEITLPALQPGSSIMPGKVNPVIPEATAMACAQVIGNDTAITVAGQAGSFQLNTMLPLIAHCLIQSIHMLAHSANHLADKAIAGFEVHREHIRAALARNPTLITALTPEIGYDRAVAIVESACEKRMSISEAAAEMTEVPRSTIERLLNPLKLTGGDST